MIPFLLGYCITCWIVAAIMLAKDDPHDEFAVTFIFWMSPIYFPFFIIVEGIPRVLVRIARKLLGEE